MTRSVRLFAFAALALFTLLPGAPAAEDNRCYELRTYYANPGKLEALLARFRDHTCQIFEKQGMQNIGYWVPADNKENTLVYLLAFPTREARQEAWKKFAADPEWQQAYRASTKDGRLVKTVKSVLLEATDYSPAVGPSGGGANRTFELRTYTASPGKLDALHTRFRDHTLDLFSRHGMTHIGYWTPLEEKDGSASTLVYMLAHRDQAARDKSFADFRQDPDWTSAKAASEKEGSLTVKVESLLLTPTDFSRIK